MIRANKKFIRLRKLLVDFFSLIVRYFGELDSVDDELTRFGVSRMERIYFKGSVTGKLSGEFDKHHKRIDYMFNFIRWYIQGLLKWYELFSSLVSSFGVIDWFSLLREENKFEKLINPKKADSALLSLNIESAFDFIFPELKDAFSRVVEESKSVPKWVEFFLPEKSLELIKLGGEIAEEWLRVQEDILDKLEGAGPYLVENAIGIVKLMIAFHTKFKQLEKIFAVKKRHLENFIVEDLWNLSGVFNKLQGFSREVFHIKNRSFERVGTCYLLILSSMWGDEAKKMLSDLVEFQRKPEEVVPEELPLEDLHFSVMLARMEMDVSLQENESMKERLEALKKVEDVFSGLELILVREGFERRVQLQDTYCNKISEALTKIQEEINKIREGV